MQGEEGGSGAVPRVVGERGEAGGWEVGAGGLEGTPGLAGERRAQTGSVPPCGLKGFTVPVRPAVPRGLAQRPLGISPL